MTLKQIERRMTPEQIKAIKKIAKAIDAQREPWNAMAFIQTEDSFNEMILEAVQDLFNAPMKARKKHVKRVIQRQAALEWLRALSAQKKKKKTKQ